jgi:hypothetical protein
MLKLSRIARVDVAVVALVTALAAMPVFAALPVEIPFVGKGLPMRDWILMGSLALLAVAVALKLMRGRTTTGEPIAEGHDLRWWHNP